MRELFRRAEIDKRSFAPEPRMCVSLSLVSLLWAQGQSSDTHTHTKPISPQTAFPHCYSSSIVYCAPLLLLLLSFFQTASLALLIFCWVEEEEEEEEEEEGGGVK